MAIELYDMLFAIWQIKIYLFTSFSSWIHI